MAEDDTPPEGGTPPPEEPPDAPADDTPAEGQDLASELAKWKALARKHEQRARKGLQAEQQLAELENAKKTELEKAQDSARDWQSRAEQAELQVLRLTIAAKKGLPFNLAQRLQGANEQELEDDADELLSVVKRDEPPPNGGAADRAPRPRLKPGAVAEAEPVETDPAKLAALISR